jgi:hypothetical protein
MHCEGKIFAWCDCSCALGRKVQEVDSLGTMGDMCDECVIASQNEICVCSTGNPCPVHPKPEEF